MRKLQQEREKKRLEEAQAEEEKRKAKELLDREITASEKKMKRPLSDSGSPEECSTSDCSAPTTPTDTSSNLSRFLECTTPVVHTQYLPMVSNSPILKILPKQSATWVYPLWIRAV